MRSIFTLPSEVTVIKPEFSSCKGCAQRVDTYIKSVKEWQVAYDKIKSKLDSAIYNLEVIGKSRSWDGEDTAAAQLARQTVKNLVDK